MARIRSVHPGLWTDEQFVTMSMQARLFLIGLWGEADDYGVFEWKPARLKMRLAPMDDVDVPGLLQEMVDNGFVVPHEAGGKTYGLVKNFRKFQRPKHPSSPTITVDEYVCGVIGLPYAGDITPALPQPSPRTTTISPQMEDGGDKREEEKEKNTAPRKRAADYEFEGDVIRVNAADMKKWRRAYPDLGRSGGLEAYLTKRDVWLAKEAPADARKSWFISTSQWLANENRKAAMELARSPPTGAGWEDPSS